MPPNPIGLPPVNRYSEGVFLAPCATSWQPLKRVTVTVVTVYSENPSRTYVCVPVCTHIVYKNYCHTVTTVTDSEKSFAQNLLTY